jgi:hypothetical protein
MPVTVRGGDILFNDGSTQATAAVTGATFTATDAIGSVMVLSYTAAIATLANGRKPGDSISGSLLFRCTAGNSGQWFGSSGTSFQVGQMGQVPLTAAGGFPANLSNRTTAFNTQQYPSGTATWSPCSGTWRALNSALGLYYDGYSTSIAAAMLCIRIA